MSQNKKGLPGLAAKIRRLNKKLVITYEKLTKAELPPNDRESIPIQHIEDLLDDVFSFRWSFVHVKSFIVNNTYTFVGVLRVWDDELNEWIERSGTSTCSFEVYDPHSGQIEKLPKAESFAIATTSAESLALKKAAKRLGPKFGRYLNRLTEDLSYYKVDNERIN